MKASVKKPGEMVEELKALKRAYNLLLKRTEKNEEIYLKTLHTSPDSVNINRLSDGLFMSVNDGFTKIMGYAREEVEGRSSLELNIWKNPDSRKHIIKELARKGTVEGFESEFVRKDGSFVTGLMSASLIEFEGEPCILNITKDITSYKRITEELEKEQYLANALLDNLEDAVYFKDLESRFIRINRMHIEKFGISDPSEAIGKTDFDFFTFEHAMDSFNDEKEIILTGKTLVKEERETMAGKSDKWVLTVKMPLRNETGAIIGTFGISRDITKQKYAEETLKLSEERFRSVAQTANDAIITADATGNIIGWNRGAELIFDYQAWEVIGQHLDLIIPDELLTLHVVGMERVGKGGERHVIGKTVELEAIKRNKARFPIELSLSEWQSPEGRFFTAIIRDISERKRIELENKAVSEIAGGITSTSNLSELLKLIHDALGKVVYAENMFVALFDHKTAEFSFPYFVDKFDVAPLSSSLGKSCTSYVFRTGQPYILTQSSFDELCLKGDVELVGTPSPSWVGIPLRTPSRNLGVLVLQHYEKDEVYTQKDARFLVSVGNQIAVSIERKLAEEEIMLKSEMLQQLNSEKDKFFSIIAHDLRGPLSAFVDVTKIIAENIQNMSLNEIRELVVLMKKDATTIFSLLENLLEWSRLQRGVLEFKPVPLEIYTIVESCLNSLTSMTSQKNISVINNIEKTLMLNVDQHMIETVFRNLLSNGIKFTPVKGTIVMSSSSINGITEVRITDNGIGIPDEIMQKLFTLSGKINRKGTNGEASSGLGLILCKEFVERNGGSISAESKEGNGSTFSIKFGVAGDVPVRQAG